MLITEEGSTQAEQSCLLGRRTEWFPVGFGILLSTLQSIWHAPLESAMNIDLWDLPSTWRQR